MGWTDSGRQGLTEVKTNLWRVDGHKNGRMDGWMDGWTNGWDGWMDGRRDRRTEGMDGLVGGRVRDKRWMHKNLEELTIVDKPTGPFNFNFFP